MNSKMCWEMCVTTSDVWSNKGRATLQQRACYLKVITYPTILSEDANRHYTHCAHGCECTKHALSLSSLFLSPPTCLTKSSAPSLVLMPCSVACWEMPVFMLWIFWKGLCTAQATEQTRDLQHSRTSFPFWKCRKPLEPKPDYHRLYYQHYY